MFNGKEFIEAHGLNEYDSKARMYYAPIMRTTTIDPMCESYYHISPYAWCGNNPVNAIDLDGKKWKTKRDISIAQKLSQRAHSNIKKQLNKLSKLQIKRSKSPSGEKMDRIDKEIADVQIKLKRLVNLEKNITLLTNTEENTYTFKIIEASIAHLEKTEDGTVIINHFDNEGSTAHELTHAAQYEKGKVVYDEERGFISNAPEGLVGLEIEAYQTEYSINGYVTAPSDEGDVKSSLDINEDWIKGIRDPITGGHVYNPEADYNNPLGNIHKPWKFEPQKLGL